MRRAITMAFPYHVTPFVLMVSSTTASVRFCAATLTNPTVSCSSFHHTRIGP